MANDQEDKIIFINGRRWRDVTNETHSGALYPLHDVIACRGNKPDFISS